MIDNEIEMGGEGLERIGNVFRGEKSLIDDFGEGLYVIVLRVWKFFLRTGSSAHSRGLGRKAKKCQHSAEIRNRHSPRRR
jgi:hypothetical protein